MTGVDQLDDPAARCAIKILGRTGLRLGELLDLELDCVIDYADHGAWLRMPLGKLSNERTVPLDQPTLDAFDDWVSRRGRCRPLIHPRTQRPVEFLFVVNCREWEPVGSVECSTSPPPRPGSVMFHDGCRHCGGNQHHVGLCTLGLVQVC
jgi:Phage integrase family